MLEATSIERQFAGDRRMLWIASEWQDYSARLADWALEHLANRRDVWSQYTLSNGEVRVVMLPIKERRKDGTDMVTETKLKRHFAGRSVSHLIGLHSISDHRTAKWFAIDIDLHDPKAAKSGDVADANLAAGLEWTTRLREAGLDPLLLDSNGAGGYHVWVLLDKEYPLADVYDFADSIRADWQQLGLPRKPEIFPPKRAVDDDDLPYTLRVPGRHHTRSHFTRVRNFDELIEGEWLEGGEAIEAMLSARPSKLPRISKRSKAAIAKVPAKKTSRNGSRKNKPRVCVDLDGVLAKYDKWKGPENIGDPLPGALEFARSLSRIADIIIFTSRCSEDLASERRITDPAHVRLAIIEWLDRHHFPYHDVYTGHGKPVASAFIDDRAIHCSPQSDPDSFEATLKSTRELIRRKAV